MTTEFRVPDASCGHCKATIESAVAALENVTRVQFDLESKHLRVDHSDAVSLDDLSTAIRNAGYSPQLQDVTG